MTRNRIFNISKRFVVCLLSAAAVFALPGCVKWNLGEPFAMWKSEPKPQTPENVLAVWTDTTLHQPGKPAVRGFGGRVMFFGQGKEDKSVPVEGNVIVYAFDDDRADAQQPAPEKKFVFPAENLEIHESEASLGPSYSFWLPWDNAGGQPRRLSLLTRFEDKSGKIVMSKAAHVLLPGVLAAPESGQTTLPASQPMLPTAAVLGGLGMTGFAPGEVAGNGEFGGSPGIPGPMFGQPEGVQQASYQGLVSDPFQLAAPTNTTASRSAVTIDVAPGQAQRLLVGRNERGDLRSRGIAGSGAPRPAAASADPDQRRGGR